jgi:hypothetical protein
MTTLYRLICINGHRWKEAHHLARLLQVLRTSRTKAVRSIGYGSDHVVSCPKCGCTAVYVARLDATTA